MKALIGILAATLLLPACTTGVPQREADDTVRERYLEHAGDQVGHFSYYGRIHGWRPLSRDMLVIWATANQPYLIRVSPTCFSLERAAQIGVTRRTGNWVRAGLDDVRIGEESCRIAEIRPIDEQQMRADEEARDEDSSS